LPEGWEVNPADYAYDGEVNAEVFIDESAAGPGVLAAFVDGECRGVMGDPQIGPTSKLIYTIRVYSNAASGEEVSFQFFYPDYNSDPGTTKEEPMDQFIFDIQETIDFASDMVIGDAINPFVMNAMTSMEFNKAMTSGWNWFSIYLTNGDMSVNTILASLNAQDGDYIKDRKGSGNSATFYDGFGWFGTLEELDPIETYKTKLTNGGDLIYQGAPIDYETEQIEVLAGWNWIGYPIPFEMSVGDYLGSLDIVDGDYLKDQINSSTFYDGFGWFGQLETMVPGDGYVLRVDNAGFIYSPDQLLFKATSIGTKEGINVEIPRYDVRVHDFEFSGSAMIEVFTDGYNVGAENNILYAFNQDDVCVGIINGLNYPMNNKCLYNLMMYSNTEEGDEIHFKFFNKESNMWYAFEETMEFESDMVLSSIYHPFELRNAVADDMNIDGAGVKLYPNPFVDELNISFSINESQNVRIIIYDGQGRMIEVLADETFAAGSHTKKWMANNAIEGAYYIRIEKANSVENVKVLKIK